MGKGSKRRPTAVSEEEAQLRYQLVFGSECRNFRTYGGCQPPRCTDPTGRTDGPCGKCAARYQLRRLKGETC